ncbi:hypothetical protein T459_09427 [Capsicum annuum]|uniref:Uncharacterized protein n=1 Tax=Capsicum annuum TaxID=4072 RepID=A0A2G2ZZE4_CAPAN|nr:hypothetical protein T459_09427 [Capsicum annuum]
MGGKSSKSSTSGRYSSYGSSSNSGYHSYTQSPYTQPTYNYPPPPSYQSYGGPPPESRKRLDRKYSKIDDDYNSLEQNHVVICGSYNARMPMALVLS